jgi:hypothetical protein
LIEQRSRNEVASQVGSDDLRVAGGEDMATALVLVNHVEFMSVLIVSLQRPEVAEQIPKLLALWTTQLIPLNQRGARR